VSGTGLVPDYDGADERRNADWERIANGGREVDDTDAQENVRALVTTSGRQEEKQEAGEAVARGMLTLASAGELKTRQDVPGALERAGVEVVRTTKSSSSIADPDEGRNIRLKGAIYEQSFNAG
ncbi:nuclease, partial [Leclercia adecarboxylata]|nr:nuclease [Leclercia adecarboxylata]